MAVEAEADYLGVLVNVPISERSLTLEQAKVVADSSRIPVMTLLYGMGVDEIIHVVDAIKPYGVHLLGKTPVKSVEELRKILECQIWLTVYLPVKGQSEVNIDDVKGLMAGYESAGADAIVIDTVSVAQTGGQSRYGGTGKVADWNIARELVNCAKIPVFLAGGINPDNVKEALRKVNPYGVDLASGVERVKGKRDPEKVKKLMQAVIEASSEIYIVSQSPEYTKNIGKIMGEIVTEGSVIGLCGDLGSGKTTLAQGIAEGLGVKSFVTSPTFVIVAEYEGRHHLYHIDTYRLNSSGDMTELGYEEFFYGNGVTVIEWAQKIEDILPDEYIRVDLEYISENERQIVIIAYGQRFVELVEDIGKKIKEN